MNTTLLPEDGVVFHLVSHHANKVPYNWNKRANQGRIKKPKNENNSDSQEEQQQEYVIAIKERPDP